MRWNFKMRTHFLEHFVMSLCATKNSKLHNNIPHHFHLVQYFLQHTTILCVWSKFDFIRIVKSWAAPLQLCVDFLQQDHKTHFQCMLLFTLTHLTPNYCTKQQHIITHICSMWWFLFQSFATMYNITKVHNLTCL